MITSDESFHKLALLNKSSQELICEKLPNVRTHVCSFIFVPLISRAPWEHFEINKVG